MQPRPLVREMAAQLAAGVVQAGAIYLVLTVYGFLIDSDSSANFVPVNAADNVLHLGPGLGMLAAGLVLAKKGTAADGGLATPGNVDPAAARAVADLLVALGQDLGADHLLDTARRVAAAYIELLSPTPFSMTTFPNEEDYDEMVLVRDIPFTSLCQQPPAALHRSSLVAYLPVSGSSGCPSWPGWWRRSLQPRGVGVVLDTEHSGMSLRGVRATGARTTTYALRELIREDGQTRSEFLSLTTARLGTRT